MDLIGHRTASLSGAKKIVRRKALLSVKAPNPSERNCPTADEMDDRELNLLAGAFEKDGALFGERDRQELPEVNSPGGY